jgi:hypothetical protein
LLHSKNQLSREEHFDEHASLKADVWVLAESGAIHDGPREQAMDNSSGGNGSDDLGDTNKGAPEPINGSDETQANSNLKQSASLHSVPSNSLPG